MDKKIFIAFILLTFGLFVTVVYAEDIASPSDPIIGNAKTDVAAEPETYLIEISNRDFDSNLPFVLQQDHKACIDKCSRSHTGCINKVGNDPSAINNCDEQRWRCTLSCDNQFYGSNTLYLFDRY